VTGIKKRKKTFFIYDFWSSCKLEVPLRWCSSQQYSFPNSYYKINKNAWFLIITLPFIGATRRSFFYKSCEAY